MKARSLIVFKEAIDDLRRYLPTQYLNAPVESNLQGGHHFLLFANAPVMTENGKVLKTAVTLTRDHKQANSYIASVNRLRISNIRSPFIQTLLYHGRRGKISNKATCDLFHLLEAYAEDKKYVPNTSIEFKHIQFNIKELFAQITLAVQALHSKGYVHRDIKTENILATIRPNGSIHLELADLDTVIKENEAKLFNSCTPEFLAPEIRGPKIDNRYSLNRAGYPRSNKKKVDCFALGVTFQEILSHINPKKTPEIELANHIIKQLTDYRPYFRANIDSVLNHPFFATNQDNKDENYFAQVLKKFKRTDAFYDSYFQSTEDEYPVPEDAFLILPKYLKEIYQTAADLHDALWIYQDCNSSIILQKILEKATDLKNQIDDCLNKNLEVPLLLMQIFYRTADDALKLAEKSSEDKKDPPGDDFLASHSPKKW